MDITNKKTPIIFNTNPYFKTAIDPVNPNNESKSGLQNGHAVAKKLTNIPVNPALVEI